MTTEQIAQSEILFCDLLYALTGETLHFQIPSQSSFSGEVELDDEKFYNQIEKLSELQENSYILYVNAINDSDAEKALAEYKKYSKALSKLINT